MILLILFDLLLGFDKFWSVLDVFEIFWTISLKTLDRAQFCEIAGASIAHSTCRASSEKP